MGTDLCISASHHHQPPPPPHGCEFRPSVRGCHHAPPPRDSKPARSSHLVITVPSPEIVPGAGVRASGVRSDSLIRGPQAENPNLAVIARAGSGGETRADARPHSGKAAALGATGMSARSSPPETHAGQAGVQAGKIGEGRTLSGRPSCGVANAETVAKLPGFKSCPCLYVTLGRSFNLSLFRYLYNGGKENDSKKTYYRGFSWDLKKNNTHRFPRIDADPYKIEKVLFSLLFTVLGASTHF